MYSSRYTVRRLAMMPAFLALVFLMLISFGCAPALESADENSSADTASNNQANTNADNSGNDNQAAVIAPLTVQCISPGDNTTYTVGDFVPLAIEVGGAIGSINYEVLLDADNQNNANETTLQTGSRQQSNSDGATITLQMAWATGDKAPGKYYLWVQAKDGAERTVSDLAGPIILAAGPAIEVTAPSGPVEVEIGQSVALTFAGSDAGGESTIEVFFDKDRQFSNGMAGTIANALAESAKSASWNTTGIAGGTYYVGASIGRDATSRVFAYAPGQVVVKAPANDTGDGTGNDGNDTQTAIDQPPHVVLSAPKAGDVAVVGDALQVSFDAGDAEQDYSYELFYDQDGTFNGNEQRFESGSRKITNVVQTTWNTSSLTAGSYYVLVSVTDHAGQSDRQAAGPITLSAKPKIEFNSPTSSMAVVAGEKIDIALVADSPGNAILDVFYDNDDDFNNGVAGTVATGLDPAAASVSWDTSNVPAGTYRLGASLHPQASRQARSINDPEVVYADGLVTIAVAAAGDSLAGLQISVSKPAVSTTVYNGSKLVIEFGARDTQGTATIDLFYAPQNADGSAPEFTGSEARIVTGLNLTRTSYSWTVGVNNAGVKQNLEPGVYRIGASLGRTASSRLFTWAPGKVLVRTVGDSQETAMFRFSTPSTRETVKQGDKFKIKWMTTYQRGERNLTLFRERDEDNDGQGDKNTRTVIATVDAVQASYDFDSTGLGGKFLLGGILTPIDGSGAEESTVYARGSLTVMPKMLWTGYLATRRDSKGNVIPQVWKFQGAVLRGHNLRDNLGSSMLTVDDYDRDGHKEIVLVAQFGKPWFFRQEGRGAGEAYMIYGQSGRFMGNYDVNGVGASIPGVIFTGIIPNPYEYDAQGTGSVGCWIDPARAGTSVPYTVDGEIAPPFATEGLRSMVCIPDQDNDGKQEIVFSFPYCNSFSLAYQSSILPHPAPLNGLGRLENNGHFLRGGLVIVSSRNPLIRNRQAVSRHGDRVLQLHEVGQVFDFMGFRTEDRLPTRSDLCPDPGGEDTITYPCDGFWQNTLGTIEPPRLANPMDALGMMLPGGSDYFNWSCGELISLDQIDPPWDRQTCFLGGKWMASVDDCNQGIPPTGRWPLYPQARVMGTGFYSIGNSCSNREMAGPLEPYGCRILGQTTTQRNAQGTLISESSRFGHSISVSGDYLLIGAPMRTVTKTDVPSLPTASRLESGEIYMLQLKRSYVNPLQFPWFVPGGGDTASFVPDKTYTFDANRDDNREIPAPHNYIISDLGYGRCAGADGYYIATAVGHVQFEMTRPFHIVGGAPGERVGDVTGLHDINGDGIDDFAVASPAAARFPTGQAASGAVYLIYRRQPEIENHYLLEELSLKESDPQRLNGMMIIGQPGENIGRSLAGGGPLNDDYNNDGYADLLIGSPEASSASGYQSGEVFILWGGRNLLSPEGGVTIADLVSAGHGALLIGANAGDHAGMTIANIGDFNGDNIPDIAIASPDADAPFQVKYDSNGDGLVDDNDTTGPGLDYDSDGIADDLDGNGYADHNDLLSKCGLVYIVFGGKHLSSTIPLSQIGTPALPGVVLVGHKSSDALGGGLTQNGLASHGLAAAGDIDGDGLDDLLVSSILADPEGKTDAGEVYLVYGFQP